MAREDLSAVRDAPARPAVTREDFVGAVEVFLLVFLSTFPVVVPFILMHDARLALRTSNAIAVSMLMIGGWSLGHYSGVAPWPMGLSMAGARRGAGRNHDCAGRVVGEWPS